MSSTPITATIITLNEENNLPRALESLDWVDEVIVVDSGSRDKTQEIAKKYGAKVHVQKWEGYGKQKNFAQNLASHDWILNIDADEQVPEELASWIQSKLQANQANTYAFAFPRKTFYLGKWIRHGGWYPNHVTRLSNRKFAKWTEPEVHEVLDVKGDIEYGDVPLNHFTFRGIEDQIRTNLLYSKKGYHELKKKNQSRSLFKLILKPIWKFFETYFLKRGFMDGMAGFIISVNAAHSVFLKYAYFYEEKKN